MVFFSTTSSFDAYSSQIKLKVFPGATAINEANFLRVKPFDKNETECFWKHMKVTFPNDNKNVSDLTFDEISKRTGLVPRNIKSI